MVDWLRVNPQAKLEDIQHLKTQPYTPETAAKNKRVRVASRIVKFIEQSYQLFHDDNQQVYAQHRTTGITALLNSRYFKTRLTADYYQQYQTTVSDAAIKEALTTLKGLALSKAQAETVYLRTAIYQGRYYLDLGQPNNSHAVEISADGWQLVDTPPVKFLRTPTAQPLPEPLPHGDFSLLWPLVNIPKEARLLVTTFLIDALRVDSPFPLLEICGYHGTAKSTTQQLLRRVIDPSSCDLRGESDNKDDLFVSASKNWVLSRENLSHLPPKQQDAMCLITTGGGHVKRELYTDAEEFVIAVKRPIMINGISPVVTAQDLLDRTISIELCVLNKRQDKQRIMQQFEQHQPSILGGLLDIMVGALKQLPSIDIAPDQRPRLIEFAKLGQAVAMVSGGEAEIFMQQFNAYKIQAIHRCIEGSPIASAVVEWFDALKQDFCICTAKELLDKLEGYRPKQGAWPHSPGGLSNVLRRIAPVLPYRGITMTQLDKSNGYKRWKIEKIPPKHW